MTSDKLELIKRIREESLKSSEDIKDIKSLDAFRVKYLGRKSEISDLLSSLKDLSIEERRNLGPEAQKLKKDLEDIVAFKSKELGGESADMGIDITRPGKRQKLGALHPLTKICREMCDIFTGLNFSVVEGPEMETEHYNFDALNIPEDHPAREMWDTFWIKGKKGERKSRFLMRTHTSPVQIRYMETHEPPFQIVVPGRVFRYEAIDASHEINFYQLEGLMVGKDISLANFKFVIEEFFRRFFNERVEYRLRPSYFPFVEPGVEVDIKFRGKWLEVLGAGMVHPKVLEAAHLNPRDLTGFAFGMGVERMAMIKYNIPDIRMFYSNDLRFLKQF